eukprot:7765392-Lingulodinium_polyedra.AAC.1
MVGPQTVKQVGAGPARSPRGQLVGNIAVFDTVEPAIEHIASLQPSPGSGCGGRQGQRCSGRRGAAADCRPRLRAPAGRCRSQALPRGFVAEQTAGVVVRSARPRPGRPWRCGSGGRSRARGSFCSCWTASCFCLLYTSPSPRDA